jgi:periplasmic mercuric ion binding protein
MNKLTKAILIGIALIPVIFLISHLDRYINPYSYVSSEETSVFLKSVMCGMCVTNIEKALSQTEGVIRAKVSLKSKEAYVSYNERVTNINRIEDAITAAGYDANDKPADPLAFAMLSECCRNEGNAGDKINPHIEGVEKDQKSCAGGCCN